MVNMSAPDHASLEFYVTMSYCLAMFLENPQVGQFFTIFSMSAFMLTQYMDSDASSPCLLYSHM